MKNSSLFRWMGFIISAAMIILALAGPWLGRGRSQ